MPPKKESKAIENTKEGYKSDSNNKIIYHNDGLLATPTELKNDKNTTKDIPLTDKIVEWVK